VPYYPTAIPNTTNYPDRSDDVDWIYAVRYNEVKNELIAICAELGISPSGDSETVVVRLNLTLQNLVEDESPQLGGDLEANGHDILMADNVISRPEIKDYSETKTAPSSSSNVLTLDLEAGNVFEVTLTENVTTLTLSNPSPTTKCCSFTLILTQDSTPRTVAWGAAVHFGEGEEPDISTADAVYILTFFTLDAGTKWYGFLAGSEMAVPA